MAKVANEANDEARCQMEVSSLVEGEQGCHPQMQLALRRGFKVPHPPTHPPGARASTCCSRAGS
jgi:hypothetical protein